MIVIVAAVVVLMLAARSQATADGAAVRGALGAGPLPGGADGSPQSQTAYQNGGGPPGNTGNATAHKIESALGGLGGAGLCTYFGAGAAAPLCAKVGSALGPKAVALGNFTTIKTLEGAQKATGFGNAVLNKGASIGSNLADRGATYADRAYSGAGALPGPVGYIGRASVAPIKIAADLSAKGAHVVETAVGGLTSGTKAAASATVSTVKKVLGWL
jgi:hypothetical protein